MALFNFVRRLFTSVPLGISLMGLIAIYLAIGSGFPRVRTALEMSELQYFNAWPLKVLMALLILNLLTVTWWRIPFTPPRYGVWLVHAGIITLIFGTSFYYSHKTEGLVRLSTGQAIDHYYDNDTRGLYARVGSRTSLPARLEGLPRFATYAAAHGNARALDRPEFHDLEPTFQTVAPAAQATNLEETTLAQQIGVPDLRVDLLEYYPYAQVARALRPDPAGDATGIRVALGDPSEESGTPVPSTQPTTNPAQTDTQPTFAWLVAADPNSRVLDLGNGATLAHADVADDIDEASLRQAVSNPHHLEWHVGPRTGQLDVQIGKTYPLADTGYRLTIENFDPSFPLSGTGELVPVLTMTVNSQSPAPVRHFRRMVLSARPLQTDFALDAPGAGPMGKRQKAPIDNDLTIAYTLHDPLHLVPPSGSERHTLITAGHSAIYDVITHADGSDDFVVLPTGAGTIRVHLASANQAPAAPFANIPATQPAAPDDQPTIIPLHIQRFDHLRHLETIVEVPPPLRERDIGEVGPSAIFQVLKVRVRSGDWHTDVLVPYSRYALEDFWEEPSTSEPVTVPGAQFPFQLRLGQVWRPLPAQLTLEKFEMIPYDGAGLSGSKVMRDFRSTVAVDDLDTGQRTQGVAHLNNPIYFRDGAWLFFQAEYDPDGNWTVLGVGNRPGVRAMLAGCGMIVIGLWYAFYLKPIIIRRMKRNALRRAAANPRPAPQSAPAPSAPAASLPAISRDLTAPQP